ncbi:sugar nucleotide-binding protein [Deinococcus misasensis]|uniref:sugar nucleotide-binding protein n=1 Tax=Deinococcus misasensis TaxID=392413 RepID=UPI000689BAB7|nr:sugar nucleotide-binding protein [Deinococcus misasensis]
MRVLITGRNGTLGPVVARFFESQGAEILGWDRQSVSPEDLTASEIHLQSLNPQAIVHLAMGSENWAALLAGHAAQQQIPFVFTSTVMVFDDVPDGPHHPQDPRTEKDGYGTYKVRCEDAILQANPQANIARIGWQIDPSGQGNNMLAHLDQWQEREGKIEASTLWKPACSFMEDTAESLWKLIQMDQGGVYHLDGNARDGWTFDQVVLALKHKFDRNWDVVPIEGYRHDQRLAGHEGLIRPLEDRLG